VAELIIAVKEKKRFWLTLVAGMIIAVISLGLILPALIPAFETYYELRSAATVENVNGLENIFYFSWEGVYAQTGKPWFLWLALISLVVGLIKKPREFTLVVMSWVVLLLVEGFSYLLNIPLLAFTNLSAILIMLYLPIGLLVGVMAQSLVGWVPRPLKIVGELIMLTVILAVGIWGATLRVKQIEPFRQLMTVDDEKAMVWIKENTPEDAVFAVNLEPWIPNIAIGTDGGYWIMYYTGRKTTAGTMLSGFGTELNLQKEQAEASLPLYNETRSVETLCKLGIKYIYIGGKSAVNGKSFDADALLALPGVENLFQSGSATVLGICQ
jgi:hypothetical protein